MDPVVDQKRVADFGQETGQKPGSLGTTPADAAKHRVSFHWVKAHDGQPENERCDELAKNAARERLREVDEGYEGSV